MLTDLRSDLTKQKNADPRVLTQALIGLASLRFNGQRYEEAITFYLESIAVQEAATGLDDPALIRSLNNVATSYLKIGRLDYAYPVYRRAVRLCRQTLGEDHQVYGVLLQNYSFVLRQLGRKREAKKLEAQSRQIARACSLRDGINSTISVNALLQGTK